jgi:long-chain-fatty-acid--CoA ligase ACSBG
VCSGIYTTNSADACEYIIKDCGARIVIVENQTQLDKILECRKKCKIDVIVHYSGDAIKPQQGVLSVCLAKIIT